MSSDEKKSMAELLAEEMLNLEEEPKVKDPVDPTIQSPPTPATPPTTQETKKKNKKDTKGSGEPRRNTTRNTPTKVVDENAQEKIKELQAEIEKLKASSSTNPDLSAILGEIDSLKQQFKKATKTPAPVVGPSNPAVVTTTPQLTTTPSFKKIQQLYFLDSPIPTLAEWKEEVEDEPITMDEQFALQSLVEELVGASDPRYILLLYFIYKEYTTKQIPVLLHNHIKLLFSDYPTMVLKLVDAEKISALGRQNRVEYLQRSKNNLFEGLIEVNTIQDYPPEMQQFLRKTYNNSVTYFAEPTILLYKFFLVLFEYYKPANLEARLEIIKTHEKGKESSKFRILKYLLDHPEETITDFSDQWTAISGSKSWGRMNRKKLVAEGILRVEVEVDMSKRSKRANVYFSLFDQEMVNDHVATLLSA